jgi:Helix-turn-helix domain
MNNGKTCIDFPVIRFPVISFWTVKTLQAVMGKSITRAEFGLVAAYLVQLRLAKGWTQTQLAERLGRNQTWVSSIELAFRRLDAVELYDYCGVFGVSLEKFGRDMDAAFARASPKKRRRSVRQKQQRPRRR